MQSLGSGANTKYFLINWTTNGALANLTTSTGTRIISNISWPISSLPAPIDFNAGVVVYQTSVNPSDAVSGTGVAIGQRIVGINIRTGQVMWNITTEAPDGHEQFFSSNNAVADNGVIINRMLTGEIKAWDLFTGQVKWSTPLSYPWGEFGPYHVASAYGLYITGSYAGVYGINETNGNIEWNFHAYTPYQFETGYQTNNVSAEYAFHVGVQIADGKLYVSSAEHTPSQPATRGLNLYCLNVTNGQQLWNFSASQLDQSRLFTGAIADGYLAFASQYDSTMYVFGKGKSAITIEAPLTAMTQGQSLVITGTVLDQSPAQPGTPCVSAQSMNAWMNYLQTQGPAPANVIGVPVSIDAADPNGNFVHIATITSDGSGTYSYVWKPDLVGKYTVTATFAGDDSYGSSFSETAVGVVQAPEPSPTATATPLTMPPYEMYTLGTGVAIIIAIAVAVLLLRKRP